jgi:hypothetical protein
MLGWISGILFTGVVMSFAGTALADGPQAVVTAAQHAGLAAGSGDLGMVQRHLHHALNCLVGADGEGFDEAAGNPCGGSGAAIPQTANAEMRGKLEKVAAEIREALPGSDVAALKGTAADVQKMLQG